MLIEVKVPQLSESVSEASLVTWHKKEGEAVKRDENLVDIETDKVVLETPAPADGVLVRIIKKDGEAVTSGEVIAEIDTEAQAAATTSAASAEPAAAPAAAPAPSAPAAEPAAAAPAAAAPAAAGVASPAARKILEEKGLSATDVTGTGRGGRVTKEDALQAAPKAAAAAPVAAPVAAMPAGERPEQRVPMTKIRKRIAERLLQSKQETAMLTTFNEVNMLPVIELRKKYGEQFEKEYGVRLGFMSFFVKAACAALKKFPILNASVDGDDIIYHGYIDIGIAVGSPRGLVVPILRDADQMSFAEIEKKIAEFGQRAKDGRLTVEELTGGTFSISNGGVFGSMLSTPIINPPQSAILGIHATKDRPVVENGQIVIRPINYLALSYDHRIIDGREAVLGLRTIKEALEDPARLLLNL
ncbi:dihydrolipoyllysine-residue succinyltransferase component of 2-oxoglutarate dehydrogenase complex [Hydrogenophilus thermoluteolus]|uniref:2-oxoglutarate dehydrogenase complex dihydrolipoyllysine-residue succinyltransferase n=1 Tax=Hydrogenophilus thermoluteolus TaxID=297 RepID=UPI0024A29676|nr:2-oxoglutarate dehydrogenase complex dihydrolipoyllysine-residue succinyltransferase [Hydrogenophilus thermoluteolus]GLW60786.1 dihydrolipoyllysine-residue succinyltransferase component of 2-oxoglutarate dehydrogenase complex [Hydrogenophilus thermoluteolus]